MKKILPLVALLTAVLAGDSHAAGPFVDSFINYVQGANTGIAQPYGSDGSASPVSVSPSIVLGAPVNHEFLTLPMNAEFIAAFSGQAVRDGLTIYTIANGAGENAAVYGRSDASRPWTRIGQVSEPTVGAGFDPVGTTLSFAGTGLTGVSQVRIVGLDNGGSFPGYELMAIQGLNVPEPTIYGLMICGLLGWGFYAVGKGARRGGLQGDPPVMNEIALL